MKRIGVIFLLLPSLFEILDAKQFIIEIPGLPYSLGQCLFVLIGFTGLRQYQLNRLGQVGKAFMFIYTGMLLSSFLNGNILDDVSKSIGIIIQFLAALGWSRLLLRKTYLYFLDILMISLFLYWFFYVLNASVSGGQFISYSKSYQEGRAINHHIPGINISTASFYLLIRFFGGESSFKYFGWILLGTSIFIMLILESRSNLIVCILMSLISYSWQAKAKSISLIRLAPIFLIAYFLISFMMDKFSFIEERFSLNSDYQEQTTMGRREVYARFPFEFAQNPLGRGPNDYKIDLGRVILNAHNNYLTQILIGGILAILGVLKFFVKQVRMGSEGNWFKRLLNHNYPPQIYASYIASIVFFITLFTIEYVNILYFICLSNLISAEHIFNSVKRHRDIREKEIRIVS